MKLEVGKLYKRIDGGWLYYSDKGTTYDGSGDKIFLFVKEIDVVRNDEMMKKTIYFYDNKLCYAYFPPHVYKEIEDGNVFEEVSDL